MTRERNFLKELFESSSEDNELDKEIFEREEDDENEKKDKEVSDMETDDYTYSEQQLEEKNGMEIITELVESGADMDELIEIYEFCLDYINEFEEIINEQDDDDYDYDEDDDDDDEDDDDEDED